MKWLSLRSQLRLDDRGRRGRFRQAIQELGPVRQGDLAGPRETQDVGPGDFQGSISLHYTTDQLRQFR